MDLRRPGAAPLLRAASDNLLQLAATEARSSAHPLSRRGSLASPGLLDVILEPAAGQPLPQVVPFSPGPPGDESLRRVRASAVLVCRSWRWCVSVCPVQSASPLRSLLRSRAGVPAAALEPTVTAPAAATSGLHDLTRQANRRVRCQAPLPRARARAR